MPKLKLVKLNNVKSFRKSWPNFDIFVMNLIMLGKFGQTFNKTMSKSLSKLAFFCLILKMLSICNTSLQRAYPKGDIVTE